MFLVHREFNLRYSCLLLNFTHHTTIRKFIISTARVIWVRIGIVQWWNEAEITVLHCVCNLFMFRANRCLHPKIKFLKPKHIAPAHILHCSKFYLESHLDWLVMSIRSWDFKLAYGSILIYQLLKDLPTDPLFYDPVNQKVEVYYC